MQRIENQCILTLGPNRRRMWAGAKKRNGFRQISDNWIAFLEEPKQVSCALCRPFAQARRGDRLPGASSEKQCNGPEAIFVRCGLKLSRQGDGFDGRFRALVKRGEKAGELLHYAASASRASPSNSVDTIAASQP